MKMLALTLSAALWITSGVSQAQSVAVDPAGKNDGSFANALLFGGSQPDPATVLAGGRAASGPTMTGIGSKRTTGGNQYGLDLYTSRIPRVSITNSGLVGIGTSQPTRAVQVMGSGDVELGLQSTTQSSHLWTLQSSGNATFQIIDRSMNKERLMIDPNGPVSINGDARIDGDASVHVLTITGGSDVAEPFRMRMAAPRGTVVSIDANAPGQLRVSNQAYDRRVAGIISGANGVRPGVRLQQLDADEGGADVALSGRVYALADATADPIRPGDLLTTSRFPGHCMRASDTRKAQGAVIGKAMSGLDHGFGSVLVLVSLQ